MPLPVESVIPALRRALRDRRVAVLQAPPGAGKTTRVPLALLDEAWLGGSRIVMLEPRRLAARAAAAYMARLLGERVGDTVGHRVRLDTRVGPRTRLEVVTEGVLGRMLQEDPALDGVGLVIFDEFHERSLNADLGLALALQTRQLLREDLALLAMSATLDGTAVAALLGGAPVITSEGRAHAVETRYIPRRAGQRIEAQAAAVTREALAREPGDILVFLPGAAEIRRVHALLADAALPADVTLAPLHGNLPLEQQDVAIAPSPPGRRKVVLSTSIAETSLTIDGVRVVIDAGLARGPRFSPRTGMTSLETTRVSRASADQRRGRAGRMGPGVCWRLWAEHENAQLLPHTTPEILEADLAPLALTLADAGIGDPTQLAWLDGPPPAAFAQARELLGQLGALGGDGRITPHGRRMAALAMHPRLAHMLIAARQLGLVALACDLAALLGERDVLRAEGMPADADLRLRLELVRGGSDAPAIVHEHRVDRDAVRRVREQARQWRAQMRASDREEADVDEAGMLLALAYPDRVAQRRDRGAGDGRFLLRNGRGAVLSSAQALSASDYIVVADLDGQRPESRIFLAAPVAIESLERRLGDQIEDDAHVGWDPAIRSVLARRRRRLGALVLADAPLREPDPELVAAALLDGIASEGIAALPWSDAARRLRERLAFMARLDPSWPDASDATLAATLGEWLAPHLGGARTWADIERLDLFHMLLARLDWRQRAALDEQAPTHITVPSGSRIAIDYSDPDAPVLPVRLQEMFGCMETPRIAGDRVPLTVHLLSPAHRPVQITRDLAGFWRTTYFDVRKDLRGRYPKHQWPDDPVVAVPRRKR
ncbi:MAG TPA: ATP-dependent helicase HrpB [Gemmatimonadaceae bacterium]|nr:ATP-dependent helicase HrpB [Gemmatimonadaceae bacterium]